jgi:hypothetical protein
MTKTTEPTQQQQSTGLSEVELPAAEPITTGLVCPKCGGASLRESETRRRADLIPTLKGLTALRCRTCQERFHAKLPKMAAGVAKKNRDRRHQEPFWNRPEGRRKIAQVAIYGLSILVFVGFLLFLTNVGNN